MINPLTGGAHDPLVKGQLTMNGLINLLSKPGLIKRDPDNHLVSAWSCPYLTESGHVIIVGQAKTVLRHAADVRPPEY